MIRAIFDRGSMHVTVHTAKRSLSKLIDAALAGEDVIITDGRRPLAKLVPVISRPFALGLLKGELGRGPQFFCALEEEDQMLWEGGE